MTDYSMPGMTGYELLKKIKDVCFLLPPLLSLLLDCAKKTNQSVVSIALGALVRLIEVGGHQFSSDDWGTLLKSIRDAVYTTQPLELLNDPTHENGKLHKVSGKLDSPSPLSVNLSNENGGTVGNVSTINGDVNALTHNQETARLSDAGSLGMPSPSHRGTRPSDAGGLQRSQTLGQKIMGNIVRSFTSKPVKFTPDVPHSPSKHPDTTTDPEAHDEDESPMLGTIRSKCLTQLLLLGAIDGIQVQVHDAE